MLGYLIKYIFILFVFLVLPWYVEIIILIGDLFLTGFGLDEILMIICIGYKLFHRDEY